MRVFFSWVAIILFGLSVFRVVWVEQYGKPQREEVIGRFMVDSLTEEQKERVLQQAGKSTARFWVYVNKPYSVPMFRWVVAQKIVENRHYDSVYVTLLPHRPSDQVYSVTDSMPFVTFVVISMWGANWDRSTPYIIYDTDGDSLQYLNALWRHTHVKFPLDTLNTDSIQYANVKKRANEWLNATEP